MLGWICGLKSFRDRGRTTLGKPKQQYYSQYTNIPLLDNLDREYIEIGKEKVKWALFTDNVYV